MTDMSDTALDLLDLTKPINFPEVINLRLEGISANRDHDPELRNGPWYQYATHAWNKFYDTEYERMSFHCFLALMLQQAHAMGEAGIAPLAAGQPRSGFTVRGEKKQESRMGQPIKPGTRSTQDDAEESPVEPEPVAVVHRVMRKAAAPVVAAPAPAPATRITRGVATARPAATPAPLPSRISRKR